MMSWNLSVHGPDMNAKGVILRAFEQFRLKTCVDFRPRRSESQFISVEKHQGYDYLFWVKFLKLWRIHVCASVFLTRCIFVILCVLAAGLTLGKNQRDRLCPLALTVTTLLLWSMSFCMPWASCMNSLDMTGRITSQSTGTTFVKVLLAFKVFCVGFLYWIRNK